MYKVMLDTNILIDGVLPSRANHTEAMRLLQWCNSSGDMGIASGSSLKDVYYIVGNIFDEEVARNSVSELMGLVVVAPVGAEECDEAMRSNEPDFEDGIVRACAELNDADFIITRDKDAFAGSHIKSVTADEFLRVVDHEDKELLAAVLGWQKQ